MPLVLALLLLLTACGAAANADGPPELNLGRDICDRCGMIISDVRYASGYRLDDGTSKVFDDIGGMLVWAKLAGDLEREMWVHDYVSEEWIHATSATYVFSEDLMTPMAFGVAAFTDPGAAEEFADARVGMIHTWAEVHEMAEAGEIEDHHGGNAGTSDHDHDADGVDDDGAISHDH